MQRLREAVLVAVAALVVTACGTDPGAGSAPSIDSFTASPPAIAPGQSSTLAWTCSGATSLRIDPDVGSVTGSSWTVTPGATTSYTLTATNGDGSVSSQVTVVVQAPTGPGAPCTPGAECKPPVNVCHQGRMSCAVGREIRGDTGVSLPDGTACGAGGQVCVSGACVAQGS